MSRSTPIWLGLALNAATFAGCSGQAASGYDRAVSELAGFIASDDERARDDAPMSPDRWRAAKERPAGCVLRAKLLCKLEKPGNALEELEEAAARWPNNDDIRRATQECVIQAIHLEVAAENRDRAMFQIGEELRREIAQRQLRKLIHASAYWSEKTNEERESYLRSAFAKGTENVVREAALRTSTAAESETEIQDLLGKWQTD